MSYEIERSLRFRLVDSTYITRTPGAAGNRKTWTVSMWVKRSRVGVEQYLFSAGASGNHTSIYFGADDKLNVIRVIASATDAQKTSTQVFRDQSAWGHLVVKMDAANANLDVYWNGVEITTWDTTDEPSNIDGAVNNTVSHRIAELAYSSGNGFDGYVAEVHLVDGTAYDASAFGEVDSTTGVWAPKTPSVTYGTNGFWLSFADDTNTTTVVRDDAGGAAGSGAGSNDWTVSGVTLTAGIENDSTRDTPTRYGTDTGVGNEVSGNYPTFGSVFDLGTGTYTYTYGGTRVNVPASSGAVASLSAHAGKYYWECTVHTLGNIYVGICGDRGTDNSFAPLDAHSINASGNIFTAGSDGGSDGLPSIALNDVIGIALDLDNRKLWWSKNGQWYTADDGTETTCTAADVAAGSFAYSFASDLSTRYAPLIGTSTVATNVSANFGARPFVYSAPSGFKCLCTTNLPDPAIVDPTDYFNAVTYAGTGASLGVTGAGHQPDLVWIKQRTGTVDHALYDAQRGVQSRLEPNNTDDQATSDNGLTAFNADGFTLGTLAQVNTNATNYVAYCWKEGAIPGFDIVTYTGDGSARTISHGLGAEPYLMIVKARTTAGADQGWPVHHRQRVSDAHTDYFMLNTTAVFADLNTVWNDTAPTSSVFSVGTNALVNTSSDTYVAYLWAPIPGFSHFGYYEANGNADGTYIHLGFKPRLVIIKRAVTTTGDWQMWDSVREPREPKAAEILITTAAEGTTTDLDFMAQGVKIRATTAGYGASGGLYLIMAWAETPGKYALAAGEKAPVPPSAAAQSKASHIGGILTRSRLTSGRLIATAESDHDDQLWQTGSRRPYGVIAGRHALHPICQLQR